MRTWHWLASLLGGAVWTASATLASAQVPLDAGRYGDPAGTVPYVDPASPAAAAYGMPPAPAPGWPDGAMAWPNVSPYGGPLVDRNSYQNGLWFNEQTFGRRKYFVLLSGTLNEFADPDDTMVGNPAAPHQFDFSTGVGTGQGTTQSRLQPIFEAKDWSDIPEHLTSGGFMGMMGFFNPDDSGVMFHGFWAEEGTAKLQLGLSGVDLNNPVDLARRAEDLLSAFTGGLPLLDGQLPNTLLPPFPPNQVDVEVPGGAQPYDIYYHLTYSAQAYGAGIAYYNDPFWKSGSLKLRPLIGLRYIQLRENAVFDAADSGLSYTIDPLTDRPDPATITGTVDILQSYLRSNNKGHFGGPEIGLRLDLGGDKFLVWLQTKAGLLAYHSTREIEGFGIVRARQLQTTVLPAAPAPATTRFHQQETTTSASPLFEQSIFAKAPILAYVPIVKEMRVFEKAQFQVGYTFTVLGGVYRPGNTVEWYGFPQFPQITDDKSTWYMTSLSLGVEWEY
uniref:BBP7 family outer membrane beta-barrel protein n=1 Tax=Schlesneria paludicola TaxID=360056 RepID=A0A7C4QQB7_9PLAN